MTKTRTRAVVGLVGLLGLMVLAGTACGPRPAVENPDASNAEEHLSLDTELLVRRGDDVVMIAPRDLFDQASAQLEDKAYAECARDFDVLWRGLPDTPFYVPSLYNAGLCHERAAHPEEAAARYLQLMRDAAGTRDGMDAAFRLAEVDATTSTWTRVADSMEEVLRRQDLRHLDRLEARYRLGMARIALHDLTSAENQFTTALDENRDAREARLPAGNYFVSGCTYGLALVYHGMFSEIRFVLPEARMKQDMETKKQLARQAYSFYMRTIRGKDHFWAILSGYMIGKLFEDFYYDILTAEVPQELDEQQVADYFLALRDELRPLLERALEAYEKTSAVSERIGVDNEWARLTAERMERLRVYMDDETALKQEEAAIVAWHKRRGEIETARTRDPASDELLAAPPLVMPAAKAAAPQ